MFDREHLRKILKIFIVAFLCCDLQISSLQTNTVAAHHDFDGEAFNGTLATLDKARYHASIRLSAKETKFGDGHICSGALVAPSVVLTVASCIYDYNSNMSRHPSELKVIMGTLNRYQRTKFTLVYGVTHVYQQKTFNPHTLRDNIAIILLERDIPEDHPIVQPIHINLLKTNTRTNVHANVKMQYGYEVTSWCAKESLPIAQLIAFNASELSNQACSINDKALSTQGTYCLELTHMEQVTCRENIGAPLHADNKLIGLVSHASTTKHTAIIYTDVSHHAKWILSTVGKGNNQNSSIWGVIGFLVFTIFTVKSRKK
ncbi:coagulation factor XII [Teleopsis dalmanni]|uniref:coagulation factor XII n=1 Tax=Teleopsis dalmanni TaxID=139649 RepID=UPI0018CEB7F6|nr:coagulation factor XII [Teleopsis dalmanni]